MKRAGRSRRGLTLMEVIIVVAILGIILAFAIPMLLRSRISAAEVGAIEACRTIGTACQAFYSGSAPVSYPSSLNDMTNVDPPYIDSVLGSGAKQGYRFVYSRPDPQRFELRAEPVTPGLTGVRFFYLDQDGVLRANAYNSAGPSDAPLE